MKTPEKLQQFLQEVQHGHPELSYTVLEPMLSTGNWAIDFVISQATIPVTYKEQEGFGFYDLEDVSFGSFPSRIFSNYKEAKQYLFSQYNNNKSVIRKPIETKLLAKTA